MTAPIDQPQRDRFITALDTNFSVVASAGSGKTRAITDRIIAAATAANALETLPTLVVVTFTNRAADEMQQRARQRILEAGVPLDVLAAFNRAFFGTIHSFCMKLLRQHGHHLGLAGQLALLTDDDALWLEFVQQQPAIGATLTPAQRRCLQRLAPIHELMELGRCGTSTGPCVDPGDFPACDFREVLAFTADKRSHATATRSQERLRAWEEAWRGDDGFTVLPVCESKPLRALWDAALGPVRAWLRSASLHVAAELQDAYRAFRLAKGAIDYNDQITLAGDLLRHPEAARRIREKGYRVILDEAQDTDPGQFAVLLEIARPPSAANDRWLESGNDPPRAGHFCMVGDFQQSIFGERADLAHYRRVHQMLLDSGNGEAVEFSVTFRLDAAAIAWVNETFRPVLHGQDGQVAYVPLQGRPDVLPGQVVRCGLGELPEMTGWKEWQKAHLEADRLTSWLLDQGLEKLRARAWHEVAVLCPRKGWFAPLRAALRRKGLAAQVQSERDIKGDSPAYAWFTALTVIMAEPWLGYEIVGVLREVFGLPDHDLAAYAEGRGECWQIAVPNVRPGPVAEVLASLCALRTRILTSPLFTALQALVEQTQLRDRLLALPPGEFDDLGAELDELLTGAAAAEARGLSLAAFAEELRVNFYTTREVRTTLPNALQLITFHKAKGSEWPVVVLPFVARGITPRSGRYPRLLRHPTTGEVLAALSAADRDSDLKDALDTAYRQELERLCYVANTRARHTLVVVDDAALFRGKKDLPKLSPARLLQGAATDRLAALPTLPTACPATLAQADERFAQRTLDQAVITLPAVTAAMEIPARVRATQFIKRNPSALAEAARAEREAEAESPAGARILTHNTGALYGTWWHAFVEVLDWSADPTAWETAFAAALPSSPDPQLSQVEWRLLRAQISAGNPLARLLRTPRHVIHAEMPFLWMMNGRECVEGIIDLAIFDPGAGHWHLLDWKTNRTTPDLLPDLSRHYLPQLSAYWKAVREMLQAPVSAGLYSTATGQWLPYDEAALGAAWESLRSAPDALATALAES